MFGKNLQKIINLSDQEWVPYWINYKMLKKLIKEHAVKCLDGNPMSSSLKDNRVEGTTEYDNEYKVNTVNNKRNMMERSPVEVAFFKCLHAEIQKAMHFFEQADVEFRIREKRIRDGIEITQRYSEDDAASSRWMAIAKSLNLLHANLVSFETFCIMTFCAASKILKKHDRKTGYLTQPAFMKNVVAKANFANYATTLERIQRTQAMYDAVVEENLSAIQKQHVCYEEDEAGLFINMIQELNEHAYQTVEAEDGTSRNLKRKRSFSTSSSTTLSLDSPSNYSTSSLRTKIARYQQNQISEKEHNMTLDNKLFSFPCSISFSEPAISLNKKARSV